MEARGGAQGRAGEDGGHGGCNWTWVGCEGARMREMGAFCADEGKLWFDVGTRSRVAKRNGCVRTAVRSDFCHHLYAPLSSLQHSLSILRHAPAPQPFRSLPH